MIEMKNVKGVTLNGKTVTKISKPDGTILWNKDTKKWYEDEEYLASLTVDDIGTEQEVKVNGVAHKVRLIGIDHDTLAGGIGKAHTTWEFANLISDSNGYCLTTYWENTNDTMSANSDFYNSSIRRALTNNGSGDLHWFEKDSKTFSTTYTKSVLEMLPSDLQAVLKTVQKQVYISTDLGTWTLISFTDKLFLLSGNELGYTSSSTEGTAYDYYKNATAQTEAIRIKYQPKWHDGARTLSLTGSDLDGEYTGVKDSFAGWNSSTQANGGVMWLRSPLATHSSINEAWCCNGDGELLADYSACIKARGIAPAFCI